MNKDLLVRKLAVKLNIDETIVDKIITHQFQGAAQAMKVCNSVEISGFGKFVFNVKRAQRRINKKEALINFYTNTIDDVNKSETMKHKAMLKLHDAILDVEMLKPKIK